MNLHFCIGYCNIQDAFRHLSSWSFSALSWTWYFLHNGLLSRSFQTDRNIKPQSLDVQYDSHYILLVREFIWPAHSEEDRECLACKECRAHYRTQAWSLQQMKNIYYISIVSKTVFRQVGRENFTAFCGAEHGLTQVWNKEIW